MDPVRNNTLTGKKEGFLGVDTITRIRQQARAQLKTILLAEYEDNRVQEAARIIKEEGLAKVMLLTPDKINLQDKERYIEQFYQMHKAKEPDIDTVRKMFAGMLYYAAMMLREGKADGLVAGASHTTPDIARAAIRCLGTDERFNLASSCFIISVANLHYGDEGTFVFADCGIIPEPNSRQLACIAVSSAELAKKVLGFAPRIAFLSYSTKGSAKTKSIDKIKETLALLKEMEPALLADGEMQVDAAIIPEVGKLKCPESPIAGRANILVFPNLEAGNIGYKLVQRLAGARALGPLLLGLNKPASDLSRGCSVEDIVDCAAVTAIRAQ